MVIVTWVGVRREVAGILSVPQVYHTLNYPKKLHFTPIISALLGWEVELHLAIPKGKHLDKKTGIWTEM